MSFIFGGDTGISYEQLQKKRAIADALVARNASRAPRNVGEGLTAVGNALLARSLGKKADKRQGELQGEFNDQWAGLFNGGGSNFAPAPVDPSQSVANDTMAALGKQPDFKALEANYGLPAGYLSRTAQIESGMNPNAQNPNSSAGGLFQFIDSTAKQYGLSDKNDANASSDAAARLARDNAATLKSALGREPTAGELYLAHQQGGGGAAKLLSNPNARAVDVVGGQAVKLNGGDANMTAGEFAAKWTGKFGGQAAPQGGSGMTIQALAEVAGNPLASPGQKAIVNALLQQQLQANDPSSRIDLQLKQAQLAQMQNPKPKQTSTMQEYEFAKSQGFEGTFTDYKTQLANAGKSTTNVTVGGESANIGPIPKGYTAIKDPNSEAGYRMVPIPGGPEDTTANDAVAKESKDRAGGIVTEDIDRALGIIKDSPGWTTGIGSFLASAPGTQAKSLSGLLQTIKANIGFDRLQQMRDASKTGGALGAINKSEMDLLQAVLGNLDQSLSAEDLTSNLERVNGIYMDIIHGKGNWEKPPAGNIPEGIDPADWDFMTDEEKALFQ